MSTINGVYNIIELVDSRFDNMMQLHMSNQNDTEKSQNDRLNNIMLVLTIVTVITLPYSILSGVFGMNVNLPLQATDHTLPEEERDSKYHL